MGQLRLEVRPILAGRAFASAALSLLLMSGAAMGQDVSRPGDPAAGSSGNYPGGESPSRAIDNIATTKYLNFDGPGSGIDIQPSGSGIVRALGIMTANDDPGRDPTSYILIGSNDGVNGVEIARGSLFSSNDRYSFAQATFSNDTAYSFYRVIFPTLRGSDRMQVAEVQLLEQPSVVLGGAAILNVVYTNGASSPGNEGPAQLFDGNCNTKCGVFAGFAGPTVIDFAPAAGSTIVSAISVIGGNDDTDFPGRTPSYFLLSGSNDGVTFTELAGDALVQNTSNMQAQEFAFANTTAYSYYRIEFGQSSAYFTQIGEVQLFGSINAPPPANDQCAGATTIVAGTITGDNFLATGTEPSSCGDNDLLDVWYDYSPTTSGPVEVNTFGTTGIDPTLSIFDGCGGTLVGCNDISRGMQARLRWNAVSGHHYKIRVASNGAGQGQFTLNLIEAPASHTDTFAPLAFNFNGMLHEGEAGDADRPDGYRSISDRGMHITGVFGSFDVALEGPSGLPYSIVTTPFTLDMICLGDRSVVDNGIWAFDEEIGGLDQDVGGGPFIYNYIGVQPAWLPQVDLTGPQVSDLSSLNLAMGAGTRVGIIYNASNGGSRFVATLTFTDGSIAPVVLQCPDWFESQFPDAPADGVEMQRQLGVFLGSGKGDLGWDSNNMNVTEAVISTQSLLSGLFGDFTGKTLQSITFSDKSSGRANVGIYALTIRDGAPGTPACPPCAADFNMDGGVDGADIESFFSAWESGGGCGDTNLDGGVDGGDIEAFFSVWEAGGC